MPSWSALPMEMRGEIVKRLDFRTRFRFRHVSKTTQELVDSVPLYIPRVVLEVKSESVAKLTFYLAIEKRIDVAFVNIGGAKTSVKVVQVSNDDTTHHGLIRQLDVPDAPMLALTVFRNVAMNANTFSGAVELTATDHIHLHLLEGPAFFGERMIRTRILCLNEGSTGHLLIRTARSDVEEIRVRYSSEKGARMTTYTKRLRVRVDEEDLKKFAHRENFGWSQKYFIATKEERELIFPLEKYRRDPKEVVQILGDDDFINYDNSHVDAGPLYQRVSSCGVVVWEPGCAVEIEDLTVCPMRWACPIHADPFDHWYNTRHPQPYSKEENPVLSEVFEKETFEEYVYLVVNGECAVEGQFLGWLYGVLDIAKKVEERIEREMEEARKKDEEEERKKDEEKEEERKKEEEKEEERKKEEEKEEEEEEERKKDEEKEEEEEKERKEEEEEEVLENVEMNVQQLATQSNDQLNTLMILASISLIFYLIAQKILFV